MANSVAEMACAKLDAQINKLQDEIDALIRAKAIVRAGEDEQPERKPRKPRGPNKRRAGLPAAADNGE